MSGLLLWLSILATLSFGGFFSDFKAPGKLLIAFLPPMILVFVLFYSRLFKFLLLVIPMSWLIYIQAFRMFLELIFWLGYFGGYVPPQMTFEWLNLDIIVGVTAILAGYLFFGNGRYQRLEAILWNVFGIVLLLNTTLIALLSMPYTFQLFKIEPSNRFFTEVPFIWIPGFTIPMAIGFHLFSLKQLFVNRQRKKRRFNLRNNTTGQDLGGK